MQTDTSPFEISTQSTADAAQVKIRLPLEAWFLMCLWLLEGGVKAFLLYKLMSEGFDPIREIARNYATISRPYFLLAGSFLVVETIGPWIGLVYLIRYRYTEISLATVMWIILKRACVISVVIVLLIMLVCEVSKRLPLFW